jgi:pimeloyl-ACP methyl ester carboxylesterase
MYIQQLGLIVGVLAALIATGMVYQRVASRAASRRFPAPGELIDVGGHRLHVTCSGTGRPAVVFEAGIAASSLSWAAVAPSVAQFTRVCTYDRAGLAWSDVPSCARTFDRIVDELDRVITRVASGERCILVGHSFGSFIVRGYATRHPDVVAGLLLVDPAVEWLTLDVERSYRLRRAQYLARIGAGLAHIGVPRVCLALLVGGAPAAPRRFSRLFGQTVAQTLGRLVNEVRKLPPALYPVMQEFWSEPKCYHAMADHMAALERDGAAIAQIASPPHIPTVVISSGNQPEEHIEAQRLLAAASRDGRHVIAARSSHWIQFDEPELVTAALRELVDRVTARTDRSSDPPISASRRESP